MKVSDIDNCEHCQKSFFISSSHYSFYLTDNRERVCDACYIISLTSREPKIIDSGTCEHCQKKIYTKEYYYSFDAGSFLDEDFAITEGKERICYDCFPNYVKSKKKEVTK